MNNPDSYSTDEYTLTFAMGDHSLTITKQWIGSKSHFGKHKITLTPEETIALSCFMAEDRQAHGGYSGIDDWVGIR